MDETIKVRVVDDSDKIKVVDDVVPVEGLNNAEELNLEDSTLPGNSTAPDVANLVSQLGRLSFNLMALPLNLLPGESRYHAKNSLREGFMAFKSLVDEIAVGIDESVSRAQKAARSTKVKVEEAADIKPARDDDKIVGEGAV